MLALNKFSCIKVPACVTVRSVIPGIIDRLYSSDPIDLPPRPKKPATPFLVFLGEHKDSLQKEYPNLTYKDVVKIAAEKWRLFPMEFKQKYLDRYLKEKESYFYDRHSYETNLTEDQKTVILEHKTAAAKKRAKTRIKKGMALLGKPKRPANQYGLFFATKKGSKKPDETKEEWASRIASEWKDMPEIERKPFLDKFKELRLQFEKDMELWRKEASNVETENPIVKKAQKELAQKEERDRQRLLKQEDGKNHEE